MSNPAEFWPVLLEHATLVASLPVGSGDTAGILLDYFASEARISIPPGWITDFGSAINPSEGVAVLTCLSRHSAKILQSRMTKRSIPDGDQATAIFTLYDGKYEQLSELCSATVSFFFHLADHIRNDDHRLIVVTVEDMNA